MAVKIRLARGGRKKCPIYRVVAADERSSRDGKFLEKLGSYDPNVVTDNNGQKTKKFDVDLERVKYWLSNGALPTETVARLLSAAGVEHNTVAAINAKRLRGAKKAS